MFRCEYKIQVQVQADYFFGSQYRFLLVKIQNYAKFIITNSKLISEKNGGCN